MSIAFLRDNAFSEAFSLVMGSWPPLNFILSRKIQSRTNQNTEAFNGFQTSSFVREIGFGGECVPQLRSVYTMPE